MEMQKIQHAQLMRSYKCRKNEEKVMQSDIDKNQFEHVKHGQKPDYIVWYTGKRWENSIGTVIGLEERPASCTPQLIHITSLYLL